jgi:hypothetical protein
MSEVLWKAKWKKRGDSWNTEPPTSRRLMHSKAGPIMSFLLESGFQFIDW